MLQDNMRPEQQDSGHEASRQRHESEPGFHHFNELADAQASAFDSRRMHLVLLPTEQCNFRCKYCYEAFSRGRMSVDVQEGIKNLVRKRSNDLNFLEISWFGGEPLVAKDIVLGITEACNEAMQSQGGYFRHNISTNGYFLDLATLEELVNLGIREFQISLDGTKEEHDKTRILMGGQGTFDRIWRNLCSLKSSKLDFTIGLRIHVHPGNVHDTISLATLLEDTFGGDTRFRFHYKLVNNFGTGDSKSFAIISRDEAESYLEKAFAVHAPSQVSNLNQKNSCYICYAAKANSFTIRSDGRIVKCTVQLDDDHNCVGRLLPDGSLEIDQRAFKWWLKGWEQAELSQLSCPASRAYQTT